jgi:hypothetical protein
MTRAAFAKWLATVQPNEPNFEEVVAGWGLRYFTAAELLTKGGAHARNGLNTDPPRRLWGNIREAALAADEARHRLGSGITITSAYRSPAYNKAIGGAAGSLHMQFRALDLVPVRVTPVQLRNVLRKMRSEGVVGCRGIGTYRTFVHVDNGPSRDW